MCDTLLPLRARVCLVTVLVDILEYICSTLSICELKHEHFEDDHTSKGAVPSLDEQCSQFGASYIVKNIPYDHQSIKWERRLAGRVERIIDERLAVSGPRKIHRVFYGLP